MVYYNYQNNYQKGQSPVLLITLLFIISLLVLGVYGGKRLGFNFGLTPINLPSPTPRISLPSPTSGVTSNWQQYTNQQFRFSFKYPPGWEVRFENFNLQSPSGLIGFLQFGLISKSNDPSYDGDGGMSVWDKRTTNLEDFISGDKIENLTIHGRDVIKMTISYKDYPSLNLPPPDRMVYLIETKDYIYKFDAPDSNEFPGISTKMVNTIEIW